MCHAQAVWIVSNPVADSQGVKMKKLHHHDINRALERWTQGAESSYFLVLGLLGCLGLAFLYFIFVNGNSSIAMDGEIESLLNQLREG